MTSRILNRFNIKTDRLLRSLATDKLSCDIHPRTMIKMVSRVSRDHIIIIIIIFQQLLLAYALLRGSRLIILDEVIRPENTTIRRVLDILFSTDWKHTTVIIVTVRYYLLS